MSFADLTSRCDRVEIPLATWAPRMAPKVARLFGGAVRGTLQLQRDGRQLTPALRIDLNERVLARHGLHGEVAEHLAAALFAGAERFALGAAKSQHVVLSTRWKLYGSATIRGAKRWMAACEADRRAEAERRALAALEATHRAERRKAAARRPPPPPSEAQQEADLVASTAALLEQYRPLRP